MGEAKQRGTYEQRKAEAEQRDFERQKLLTSLQSRRASPKHTALMAALAGLAMGLKEGKK